nr:MAG TPA: hypothetical protein [Bacteriophage sp.]
MLGAYFVSKRKALSQWHNSFLLFFVDYIF